MSTPIVPALSFGPDQSSLPPPGHLLLVTDHLTSPADFILHRALSIHLKENKNGRAVLVSLADGLDHWSAIAAKSNVNLSQHLASTSLVFIDGLSFSAYRVPQPHPECYGARACPPLLRSTPPSLRGLYDVIARSLPERLADDRHGRTVIIDDMSILELVGVRAVALTRFVRALRALCRARSSSLVVRAHADAEPGTSLDSGLLRCLLGSCHVHIRVRPLPSGRSGAVSGEVAVHKGALSMDDDVGAGSSAVLYRLTEGGAVFFQKGMGASVL